MTITALSFLALASVMSAVPSVAWLSVWFLKFLSVGFLTCNKISLTDLLIDRLMLGVV